MDKHGARALYTIAVEVRREHFVALRAEPQGIHDNHSAYESITLGFRVNAPAGVVRGGGALLTAGCGAAQAPQQCTTPNHLVRE